MMTRHTTWLLQSSSQLTSYYFIDGSSSYSDFPCIPSSPSYWTGPGAPGGSIGWSLSPPMSWHLSHLIEPSWGPSTCRPSNISIFNTVIIFSTATTVQDAKLVTCIWLIRGYQLIRWGCFCLRLCTRRCVPVFKEFWSLEIQNIM